MPITTEAQLTTLKNLAMLKGYISTIDDEEVRDMFLQTIEQVMKEYGRARAR